MTDGFALWATIIVALLACAIIVILALGGAG